MSYYLLSLGDGWTVAQKVVVFIVFSEKQQNVLAAGKARMKQCVGERGELAYV